MPTTTPNMAAVTADVMQCQSHQLVAAHNLTGVHHLALGDSLAAMNSFQQALSIIRELAETVLPNAAAAAAAAAAGGSTTGVPTQPSWHSSLLLVPIPGMQDDASSFYIYDQAVSFLAPPAVTVAPHQWPTYYHRVSMILLLNTALAYHYHSMTVSCRLPQQKSVNETADTFGKKAIWLYGMCSALAESNLATDAAFAAAVCTLSLNNGVHMHVRQNEFRAAMDLLQDLGTAFYHMEVAATMDEEDEDPGALLLMDGVHMQEIWTNIVTNQHGAVPSSVARAA